MELITAIVGTRYLALRLEYHDNTPKLYEPPFFNAGNDGNKQLSNSFI